MKSLNENQKAARIAELEETRSLKQEAIATLRKSRDESKNNRHKCMAESAKHTAIMADVQRKRKSLWNDFRKHKEKCRQKSRAYSAEEKAAASKRKIINADRKIFKKEEDAKNNKLMILHGEVRQITDELDKLKQTDTCNNHNPEQSNE